MTGDCDEDAMILRDGESQFTLCGQNHGQHGKNNKYIVIISNLVHSYTILYFCQLS